MKKIQYILFALIFTLPLGVNAANFTFSPAIGSYSAGQTFTTTVNVNPGAGESISATKVSLTFPVDKLELISYTPINGTPILAHVGTVTDGVNGTIVDNVAFNPAISSTTAVATIVFKAKTDGLASVAVASDSKLLDNSNTDKTTTSISAVYTVTAPAPVVTQETATTTDDETTTQELTQAATTTSTNDNSAVGASVAINEEQTNDEQANADTEQTEAGLASDETVQADQDSTQGQLAAAASGKQGNKTWYWLLGLLIVGVLGFFVYRKKRNK